MLAAGRRKYIAFVITFGVLLVAAAIALNVGWVLLNWRQVALLVLGIVFFFAIITGLILNTIFLVREIRRNEQHDAFINAVTHELKTPIASIRLYLETLQTRDVDDARRREFYATMLADSDRLLGTVNQVLDAGRSGQRRRKKDRTRVDMAELARECVDRARARVEAAGGEIRLGDVQSPGGEAIVMGEPDELRAAVSNLVDNAIMYSSGAPDVTVDVALVQGGRLEVRVRDRGIGIPSDQLKTVFKRFYRLPGRRSETNTRGTGLGLSIVSGVARKHGGKAFAESDGPGRGRVFTIRLPKART